MALFITSWQHLAENGDQSLMACNTALESHHAKGQVCLKFALQCISGDDLDFLSLVPPRVQRQTASFQPFPSSNYVSSPVNIWQRVTSLRLLVSPQTTPFSRCRLLTPRVRPLGLRCKAEQHFFFPKLNWHSTWRRYKRQIIKLIYKLTSLVSDRACLVICLPKDTCYAVSRFCKEVFFKAFGVMLRRSGSACACFLAFVRELPVGIDHATSDPWNTQQVKTHVPSVLNNMACLAVFLLFHSFAF